MVVYMPVGMLFSFILSKQKLSDTWIAIPCKKYKHRKPRFFVLNPKNAIDA